MKHNKIALIGMMGSGKTTVSKLLSDKLNFNLFDIDEIFEKENNIQIKDYFSKYGEKNFRLKEAQILQNLSSEKNCVISCGGGIILSKENQDILFSTDITTIYLETDTKTIFERLKNDTSRPLLMVENTKEEIEKILNKRADLYNLAQIKINTNNKTTEEISKEILEILWKN